MFREWEKDLRSSGGSSDAMGDTEVSLNRFINRTLQSFAAEHRITHITVPPYHPQANPVKRVNRVLKTMIVAFLERDHREWNEHLRNFRFAYNTAHHSSIGISPALLNLS